MHSMTVDFGPSDDNFELLTHSDLKPRQVASTSDAAASSTTAAASSTLPIAYPSASATGLPTGNTTGTISEDYSGFSIIPWDPSVGQLMLPGPSMYVTAPSNEPVDHG